MTDAAAKRTEKTLKTTILLKLSLKIPPKNEPTYIIIKLPQH